MRLEDIDYVYKLLNELYNGKIKYEIFTKIYIEKLSDKFSYNTVATQNNNVVGLLISNISVKMHRAKKCSFIDDLIVNENYRNIGIGKSLLEDAVSYAKKKDCEVIELTSVLLNEKAHSFYENNGFKKHSYKFKQYLNTY